MALSLYHFTVLPLFTFRITPHKFNFTIIRLLNASNVWKNENVFLAFFAIIDSNCSLFFFYCCRIIISKNNTYNQNEKPMKLSSVSDWAISIWAICNVRHHVIYFNSSFYIIRLFLFFFFSIFNVSMLLPFLIIGVADYVGVSWIRVFIWFGHGGATILSTSFVSLKFRCRSLWHCWIAFFLFHFDLDGKWWQHKRENTSQIWMVFYQSEYNEQSANRYHFENKLDKMHSWLSQCSNIYSIIYICLKDP